MAQWMYNTPYNVGQPGSTVYSGGGGAAGIPYRGALDAARSKAPQGASDYPDGYLGTIIDRREDRVLNAVQKKLGDKRYQRGVHKGEKIDSSEYFWGTEFNPQTGLEYEAQGLKWTARGSTGTERLAHMGKNGITSPVERAEMYRQYGEEPPPTSDLFGPADPARAEYMKSMLPTWQ